MTTTSAVPAVIDWLVAAAEASPLLGQATPPVSVFDGPQSPGATQALNQVLWIGANAADPNAMLGDSAQSWPVMDHARTKDEDGTVTCSAQHWSGDPSVTVHRNAAAALVAAVELLLRGDGRTGPGDATMGGLVQWSGVDTTQWYPRQVANGVAVLVTFTIVYRARLLTTGA
jgi:hypothetical protein